MSLEIGPARADELCQLRHLCNRIFRSGRPGDMFREYPLLFDETNLSQLRVARLDGKVVAHVGLHLADATILGASFRVASVGSVGTEEGVRGRGIAGALMEDARRHAVEQGASLMLISGGRGLYHRLGYVEVGVFDIWRIPAAAGGPLARLAGPGDLDLLYELHAGEPVRFLRSRAEWRQLREAANLMNRPSTIRIIEGAARPLAYVAYQKPADGDPNSPLRALESAGELSAILEAMPALAASESKTAVQLVRPHHPLSGAPSRISFPGTLGVIDPAGFATAIQPLLRERSAGELGISADGDGAIATVGTDRIRLSSRGQLAAFLFGGETPEATDVPEFPPTSRERLREVLPLPLLWPGYNYV